MVSSDLEPVQKIVAGHRLMWLYCWARAPQVWPSDEIDLLVLAAGRGAGKNRSATEKLFEWASEHPGSRWFAAGPTRDHCLRTQFIGESGLCALIPTEAMKGQSVEEAFNKSSLELTLWNGSRIGGFTSEKPGGPRGENFAGGWGDEPAEWKDADSLPTEVNTFFSNLLLASRAKPVPDWDPKIIITGTPAPKRLLAGEQTEGQFHPGLLTGFDEVRVHVSRMSSRENTANLPTVYRRLMKALDGTRIGRQEIDAELLSGGMGDVWKLEWIRSKPLERVYPEEEGGFPGWVAKCIAIDHAVSSGEKSDETGIIVAGLDRNGLYWVLNDSSGRYSPAEWTSLAVHLDSEFRPDKILLERNQGGDLVVTQLTNAGIPESMISAESVTKSKLARSRPVVLLYEPSDQHPEGRVVHAKRMEMLVNQQINFNGVDGNLDDRVDALMRALTWLMKFDTRGGFGGDDLSALLNRGAWAT